MGQIRIKVDRAERALLMSVKNIVSESTKTNVNSLSELVGAATNNRVSPYDGMDNDLTLFDIELSSEYQRGNLDLKDQTVSFIRNDMYNTMLGYQWHLTSNKSVKIDMTNEERALAKAILGDVLLANFNIFQQIDADKYQAKIQSDAKALQNKPHVAGRLWEIREVSNSQGIAILRYCIFLLEEGILISSHATSLDFEHILDERDNTLSYSLKWLRDKEKELDDYDR